MQSSFYDIIFRALNKQLHQSQKHGFQVQLFDVKVENMYLMCQNLHYSTLFKIVKLVRDHTMKLLHI